MTDWVHKNTCHLVKLIINGELIMGRGILYIVFNNWFREP